MEKGKSSRSREFTAMQQLDLLMVPCQGRRVICYDHDKTQLFTFSLLGGCECECRFNIAVLDKSFSSERGEMV